MTKTITATFVKKPDPITVIFNPTSVKVCEHQPVSVTGTVSPANGDNGTYTYSGTRPKVFPIPRPTSASAIPPRLPAPTRLR